MQRVGHIGHEHHDQAKHHLRARHRRVCEPIAPAGALGDVKTDGVEGQVDRYQLNIRRCGQPGSDCVPLQANQQQVDRIDLDPVGQDAALETLATHQPCKRRRSLSAQRLPVSGQPARMQRIDMRQIDIRFSQRTHLDAGCQSKAVDDPIQKQT